MDDKLFIDVCRRQYHAFFAMFRQRLQTCPAQAWDERGADPPFWQQAYHTLFYADFYLGDAPGAFRMPAFGAEGLDDMAVSPGRSLTPQQLLEYLDSVAEKLEAALGRLSGGGLDGENHFPWTGPTVAHRLVYNLRHAQHHLGWMDSYVHRRGGEPNDWICSSD